MGKTTVKTRTLPRFVHVRSVLALSAAAALLASCSDQPKVRCAAARGNFAATYHLVTGTGDCAQLPGDVLAIQTYNPSNPDKTPNWNKATIGIQPTALTGFVHGAGAVADLDPSDKPYALGDFSGEEPGSDNFCVVPTLTTARVRLPDIPAMSDGMGGMTPAQAAVDAAYTWSNVRVYVTADANGTMLSADLSVTQNGCTATYTVSGLYPAVSCLVPPPMPEPTPMPDPDAAASDDASTGTDDAGALADDAAASPDASGADQDAGASGDDGAAADMPAPPAPVLDETLCSPEADISKGRPLGSGINPDVATRCDTALQMCVLAKAAPSFK